MITAPMLTLLAQNAPRDTGPEFGKASPFGLLVIVLLLISIFLLVRSMNRHLRKLPESFDKPEQPVVEAEPEPGTADSAAEIASPEPGTRREPGG
ncbi:hypothetical protein H7J88_25515 [Mycolicibacterium flavescens]|uniref:Preprotein translocase subunit SecG n=1 Tax=Mycolicibacterium flavescens TaxID=1776 RepID=A0A1E3RDM4_MYCFV|nr:hypothetical protein [Mycolicibacterium flavescens]MCV7282998.1 hypothetical protein [Mycolicibacterium flavescens]ODQ87562.1 hypothetical protein BHQ18_23460 [Mycolicibacterium flavescens]